MRACSDLLDIPLIYGAYVICSNIVRGATACLLVSLPVVITESQGRAEDWAGERWTGGWMEKRYCVDGWMDGWMNATLHRMMSEVY